MNDRERALRRRLGIQDDGSKVLVFEQSAHCDWDWVNTFPDYFASRVGNDILPNALASIAKYPNNSYTYVFCEVGYLQKFWDSLTPAEQSQWAAAVGNGTFRFSSGGITSAENLTVHTEAFVRNYLLGRQWVGGTFANARPSLQMWIPDDFGHDAQLPALLRAMGYTGAAFWRIPGLWGSPLGPGSVAVIGNTTYGARAAADAPSAFLAAQTKSVDFVWKARDGSAVQAHWLMGSYLQGNDGYDGIPGFGGWTSIVPSMVEGVVRSFIEFYQDLAPSGYMFVPCDADFCVPYDNVPDMIDQWNTEYAQRYGVTVAMTTFDEFMQLVAAAGELPIVEANPADGSPAYLPHPYWSGCYATHPALKLAHFQTVRTLLLAEAMELVLEYLATVDSSWVAAAAEARAALAAAWTNLAPSTHHDYITGTSPNGLPGTNDVYGEEQVPILSTALTQAVAARTSILDAVAGAIDPGTPVQGTAVALFNPIAVERMAGLVELTVDNPSQYESSTTDGSVFNPAQVSASGTLLTLSTLPPLGYQTAWLTSEAPTEHPTLTISESGGTFTLANEFVKATITTAGITGWFDLSANPDRNLLSGVGNLLVYYDDTGGLYRFGNEAVANSMAFQEIAAKYAASIAQGEAGPVRVSAVVTGTAAVNGQSVPFSITYSLVAHETILRITTESAAPASTDGFHGYSVMVSFPLGPPGEIAELAYATTAHWDRRAPRHNFLTWTINGQTSPPPPELDDVTFEPTHEYVVPYDSAGRILGALYHYSAPAWAISSDGAKVYGCILRNTPNNINGAVGTDTEPHTLTYALRVPTGLADPSTGCGVGTPLGEALLFNNPVVGAAIPASSTRTLASSMSVAATTDPTALVTVAKAGTVEPTQMIVRLYQPTDGTLDGIEVAIDPALASMFASGGTLHAGPVTALETPSDDTLSLRAGAASFSLSMQYARATVALDRPAQRALPRGQSR